VSWLLLGMIRAYRRWLSPALPPLCRYTPTCSEYAYEAIERYGGARGSWLAVRRLVRCTPWGGSGYDPVPEKSSP
jgi:putative membrane protein insertion efficiency factor